VKEQLLRIAKLFRFGRDKQIFQWSYFITYLSSVSEWKSIEEMTQRNDEMSHKLAVMEADKLFDHVLKALGFGGSTLAERLKLATYRYPKIRNVWPAHLARNRMVHEATYHLSSGTARDAIRRFSDALRELGIL